MSPPADTAGIGSDAVAIPGERVVVRNDGELTAQLRVLRRRDGHAKSDRLGLAPGDTASLPVPRGVGAVTVEVHGPRTTATTAFHPSDAAPVFGYRDGAIVVVRD